jgi:mono/diheme cytochrome c family protein
MSNRDRDAQRHAADGPPEAGSGLPEDDGLDLQPDVERLHRAIRREPRDPIEGREPTPWFMWAVTGVVLFCGGWYLGRYAGDFGLATHVAFAERPAAAAPPAAAQPTPAATDPIAAGQAVFSKNCQACHQPNGRGVPGAFPPVVGSEWVTGAAETVVRILLDGLHQPITVAGASYNGAMPAWRDALRDDEIAAVTTYIRQWAPNGAPAVTPEVVARLRQQTAARAAPWTAAELRATEGGR